MSIDTKAICDTSHSVFVSRETVLCPPQVWSPAHLFCRKTCYASKLCWEPATLCQPRSHASYSNKPVNLRQLPALSETCFPSAWAIFPYKKDCSKLLHCVLSAFGFCHQSWHHKELVELVKWTEFQYCHEVKHRWKINSVAHRVAGIYGLVIGHIEREPHYSNNGVQDEGKKHVLVEGDSLAAKTPEREKQT